MASCAVTDTLNRLDSFVIAARLRHDLAIPAGQIGLIDVGETCPWKALAEAPPNVGLLFTHSLSLLHWLKSAGVSLCTRQRLRVRSDGSLETRVERLEHLVLAR